MRKPTEGICQTRDAALLPTLYYMLCLVNYLLYILYSISAFQSACRCEAGAYTCANYTYPSDNNQTMPVSSAAAASCGTVMSSCAEKIEPRVAVQSVGTRNCLLAPSRLPSTQSVPAGIGMYAGLKRIATL